MPTSLSRDQQMFNQLDPQRIARAAILNGVEIPPHVSAQLEARGICVGELEQRLKQGVGFKG